MRIFVALLIAFGASSVAYAHGPKGHQSLKVLRHQTNKKFDAGMKSLSRGLGVKCSACHVKGAYEKDDVPAKEAARDFMTATIGERDKTKKSEALAELLEELDLEKAKDEAKVWQAVRSWKKKPAERAAHH